MDISRWVESRDRAAGGAMDSIDRDGAGDDGDAATMASATRFSLTLALLGSAINHACFPALV
jgi:hypothetical protein